MWPTGNPGCRLNWIFQKIIIFILKLPVCSMLLILYLMDVNWGNAVTCWKEEYEGKFENGSKESLDSRFLNTNTHEYKNGIKKKMVCLELLKNVILREVHLWRQAVKLKVTQSVSDSLQPQGLHTPWNSPGQNTGVGSLSTLQGTFPTQGSDQGLPPCRRILYQLSHKGSPRILEWVAYPFSSGSASQSLTWQSGSPSLPTAKTRGCSLPQRPPCCVTHLSDWEQRTNISDTSLRKTATLQDDYLSRVNLQILKPE